ncbi:MAG TPA: class E sortase [Solirubrobacteraceae bacterium]|jgi:sortase A|nr:class E sortase [Solirubrobacteraceae bacterium]
MRPLLRALSTVLIAAGVLLLVDAGLTLTWQEPVSALYARLTQDALGGDLEKLEDAGPTPLEQRVLRSLPDQRRRLAFLGRSLKQRLDGGEAAGRLRIPSIDLDFVVLDGTSAAHLRKGPGFFPETPFPGSGGTTAIAGHRTTYGAPFRSIDDLDRGDAIVVEMPYARFEYRVERTRIVDPDAFWVTQRVGYERLVLSACHPLYSAAQRIVVFARQVRVEPRGRALDT